MKIYGLLNYPDQIIEESTNPACPDGWVEMSGERPTPNHIATVDGSWQELTKESRLVSKE